MNGRPYVVMGVVLVLGGLFLIAFRALNAAAMVAPLPGLVASVGVFSAVAGLGLVWHGLRQS